MWKKKLLELVKSYFGYFIEMRGTTKIENNNNNKEFLREITLN